MHTLRALLIGIASVLLASASVPAGQIYSVDAAASSLSAKVPFLGLGRKSAGFPDVAGTIRLDRERPEDFELDVTIDATALTAGDNLTLTRLKGDKFFWVEKHPTVRFVGRKITLTSPTQGSVEGDLTARGVTQPVTLAVTFDMPPSQASASDIITLTGTTRINRYDFGMKSYRLIVGKYVNIELRARMVPQPRSAF